MTTEYRQVLETLKGHGNGADFLGFCRNWFLKDPLHYLSSRSAFGFEFAEIFVIEKRVVGVDNSLTRRVGESAFECLKENLASQRVGNSSTCRVRESTTLHLATPRLGKSGSRHGESGSR